VAGSLQVILCKRDPILGVFTHDEIKTPPIRGDGKMRSHHTAKVLTRINNDIQWTFQVRVQWTPPKIVGHWHWEQAKKAGRPFKPLVAGSSPAALISPTNGPKTAILRELTRRKAGFSFFFSH